MNGTVWGTIIAAVVAAAAAIYTATQGRKAQVLTSEQTVEANEREAQRKTQAWMVERLQAEVESLNARVVELRNRLTAAEDTSDKERQKRRELEDKLQAVLDSIERLKNILCELPGVKENPEVRRILKRLDPPVD
jgi:septal ring factor EnvC (AmiA/AmiB activator)